MDWLRKASGSEKIVAIGEIGLDYYWDEPDREIQKNGLSASSPSQRTRGFLW